MGYLYRLSHYLTYSGKEQRDMLLTTLVMTMVLFFHLWAKYPETDITIRSGSISVMNTLILFLIGYGILVVMTGVGKAWALLKKYTATYSGWFNGLLIGFVVTFASYGHIPVLFPGVLTLNKIERLRYGRPREGINKKGIFWTLTISLFSVVVIALFFQQLYFMTDSIIFEGAKDLSALIILFGILPFPNNYGSHLFYCKKKTYFVYAFFLIILAVAILVNSHYAIAIAFGGGALVWLLFSRFLGKEFFE